MSCAARELLQPGAPSWQLGAPAVPNTVGVAPLLWSAASRQLLAGSLGEREYGLARLFEIDALTPRSLWLALHPDATARVSVRIVADQVAAIVGGRTRAR